MNHHGYENGSMLEYQLAKYAGLIGRSVHKKIRQLLNDPDRTEERSSILEPNRNSEVKVEIYQFAVNMEIPLDEPGAATGRNSPDVSFRIQEVRCDIPEPGILMLAQLQVANVGCIVGGLIDAYTYREPVKVDYPTLTPANRVSVVGTYTGKVPKGWDVPNREERRAKVKTALQTLAETADQKSAFEVRTELKDIMRIASVFLNVGFTFAGPATIVS